MKVEMYPRFAVITEGDDEPMDVCDNCKREWKRGMLGEIRDYFQRVEPGGVVPSGECPKPGCGSLCYPKEVVDRPVKEWLQEAAWIYPKDDERFIKLLTENLKGYFGKECRVWQNEDHGKRGTYPQYLCSADLRDVGGDVVQLWRDGQTWWPMSGDYSLRDMEIAEMILRITIIEFTERR